MRALRLVGAAAVLTLTGTACSAGGAVVAAARRPAPQPVVSGQQVPVTNTSSSPSPTPTPMRTVDVAGTRVQMRAGLTVAAALAEAGVRVPSGQVLAVSTKRSLGSDDRPGHVLVNGRRAKQTATLQAGDVVTVVAGRDRIEATRVETIRLPAPNPSNLYVEGTPGRALANVGVRSGEVVVTQVLAQPQIGHLVSPGAVALTIDDGPDPTWTPKVLALLARAKVHATFCLIGRNAARYPALVRAIVAGGHTLCDHTWDHDEDLKVRPAGEIALDISRGADAIKAAAGVAPTFFRAPGGNWSPAIEAEARRQHMTPLKWTVDPRDWSRPGEASILATIWQELRPGGVILMHDGGGDRSETVAALAVLLTRLPAMGYHFVTPPSV